MRRVFSIRFVDGSKVSGSSTISILNPRAANVEPNVTRLSCRIGTGAGMAPGVTELFCPRPSGGHQAGVVGYAGEFTPELVHQASPISLCGSQAGDQPATAAIGGIRSPSGSARIFSIAESRSSTVRGWFKTNFMARRYRRERQVPPSSSTARLPCVERAPCRAASAVP